MISDVSEKCCGFRGSLGFSMTDDQGNLHSVANLAQTYSKKIYVNLTDLYMYLYFSGLLCLAILGDDFQGVDREAILESVRASQKEDGSFWSEGHGSESDMRFVFCAVAICHILQDDSHINWSALRSFIRASLNYDGGIGQGPGDESHGGSTFCAIASLSLSNRLWDESVLSRSEISRLVKWALWKQDQGFHGRAHKDDDSCYAFWIGATLEILNANHLLDKEKLRSFLLIAQHQPLGGFCKVPDPTGFPDLLHTYFSLAAFSLLREPGFSPIHASLNVSRHVSCMVILPPADLDQEEAVFRVVTHLRTFHETADCLFNRIASRIDELNDSYQGLQSRLEVVNRKVNVLKNMNTTGILTCLSRFPSAEYTPARDLLIPVDKHVEKRVFKPKSRPSGAVDMRRELEDRKQFFLPSQLNQQSSSSEGSSKEAGTPRKVAAFADMFFSETDELTFGQKSTKRKISAIREKAKNESTVNGTEIDAAAIHTEQTRLVDPLDYVPESGPIEDLDLPNILPDLPGIAEDLTVLDDIVPSIFPDISLPVDEPSAVSVSHPPTETKVLKVDENNATNEKTIEIPDVPPPQTQPSSSPEIPIPPPAPPAPPPPPPPPPALLLSPVPDSAPIPSLPQPNDRADLMAAIRAAGGAGKAKLKSVKSSRRSVKESESLSSSALSDKNSSPGNSLMVSLAKALEARRKAISGMSPSVHGTAETMSGGAEAAGRSNDGCNSGDDEWK
ncbi:hypothetical protein Y032_0315g2269 [Ancylostoma ceylanicum]|uniref:WH2 domain-containing protein n=1 Tax=Ancylostoma ceylanicum TaxID=53326 RepID=A0A016S1H3_9BILA|nr:hypothetical protein Y032_0315g2269 [Ancylostoma ceylanicum]